MDRDSQTEENIDLHFLNDYIDSLAEELPAQRKKIFILSKRQNYTNKEIADFLQKRMNSGIKNLIFVIGGPYGFSPEVYARANGKISLSDMTFSHQMVRLFFVEQLYRGYTILRNEPYHHE